MAQPAMIDAGDAIERGFVHRQVNVGELTLHVVEAGEARAPLVVLLHGFPEFWWSWRHQIRALADAGFHVIAPDMRGYNLSDKPRRVRDYAIAKLTGDVAGVIRAMGAARAIVVGHDWGGIVAWQFAMEYPEMLVRLGILNMPHPLAMQKGLRDPRQRKKSAYVFLFQLPLLPERVIARGDFAQVRKTFLDDGLPRAIVERYIEAARRSGLRGPINYYRSALRSLVTRTRPEPRRIDAPALVLWGQRDRHLGQELATPDAKWVPNARVVMNPDASHWIQDDAPGWVSAHLCDFARESLP